MTEIAGGGDRVLVGPETGDDGGVYLVGDDLALVATADFITPVCDDPRRFGRVAAANSISDVYAMGGEPLFALNLCCFPETGVPEGVLASILTGAAEALAEGGGALLGGHSVRDEELKFGLAVIGRVDPARVLTNRGARVGNRLILTKPLGTGVLVNAFKFDRLDEAGLEPALVEMERLNAQAARLAREHGVLGATDVTGFALAGHALNLARGSQVRLRFVFDALPVYDGFEELVRRGVSTGCTQANAENVKGSLRLERELSPEQREVLFDPQTSGGLLLAAPAERADDLLAALVASGHRAALVGEVEAGVPGLVLE